MNDDEPPETFDLIPGDDIGNAADVADQRARVEKGQEDRLAAIRFWKGVFADPVGRREMWGILHSAHAFETIFAAGPTGFPDPNATWFHAGIQDHGQRLYQSWLAMDREGVWLMQDEHDVRRPKPPKRIRRRKAD